MVMATRCGAAPKHCTTQRRGTCVRVFQRCGLHQRGLHGAATALLHAHTPHRTLHDVEHTL